MTETLFTDNVKIDGSGDVTQLTVQAHTTQTDPLQDWEDSSGEPLARLTHDGRLQIGSFDMGAMATADSLIEAHRDADDTSKPKRGQHLLGEIQGTLSDIVAWVVQELLLKGSGGISALHSALRVKLTNENTGTMSGAQLRAGDFETINTGGSSGSPVTEMVALRAAVTNQDGAYVTDAIGLEVVISEEAGGSTSNAYGIRVDDVNQGSGDNYAIHTGEGTAHFGDALEIPVMTTEPAGNPPTDFVKIYSKLDGGNPKLFSKNSSGTERSLSGNYAELLANTILGSSASSISLSSIPATYDHLELILLLRSDSPSFNYDGIRMTLNSDTGATSYAWQSAQITGGETVQADVDDSDGAIKPPVVITGALATSDYFALMRITFLNYKETAHYRHILGWGTNPRPSTAYRQSVFSGIWKNTANAISSIQIAPLVGSNFVAGSSYSLYGIGG